MASFVLNLHAQRQAHRREISYEDIDDVLTHFDLRRPARTIRNQLPAEIYLGIVHNRRLRVYVEVNSDPPEHYDRRVGGQMITYSEDSDAVYVYLSDAKVERTHVIDDARIIDYDANGEVVGVEFLGASAGLDLRDLPERERIESEVKVLRFAILA